MATWKKDHDAAIAAVMDKMIGRIVFADLPISDIKEKAGDNGKEVFDVSQKTPHVQRAKSDSAVDGTFSFARNVFNVCTDNADARKWKVGETHQIKAKVIGAVFHDFGIIVSLDGVTKPEPMLSDAKNTPSPDAANAKGIAIQPASRPAPDVNVATAGAAPQAAIHGIHHMVPSKDEIVVTRLESSEHYPMTFTLDGDGTATKTSADHKNTGLGKWTSDGKLLVLTWSDGIVDTLKLGADQNQIEGRTTKSASITIKLIFVEKKVKERADGVSPVSNQTTENSPDKKPQPLALDEIIKTPFAEVKVSGAWSTLARDAEVYNPVNSKNAEQTFGIYPAELEGRSFTQVPMHNTMEEAKLSFSVTKDGIVLIAVQGWGGAGRGGDWQKECIDRDGLLRQGWQETPNPGGRSLFYRCCKEGEAFDIRTDKYHPPLLVR
jgi:hypothetical protein